ncbi:hypothetical protein BHE74_00014199 [Ensete ventricosum]|nr:hypothetical protein BHE74_00014199 [Ensete ventricosum]
MPGLGPTPSCRSPQRCPPPRTVHALIPMSTIIYLVSHLPHEEIEVGEVGGRGEGELDHHIIGTMGEGVGEDEAGSSGDEHNQEKERDYETTTYLVLAKVKSMHRVDAFANSPGVCRKLVEGIGSLSGWRKRVHQKKTETHWKIIEGSRKDCRESG